MLPSSLSVSSTSLKDCESQIRATDWREEIPGELTSPTFLARSPPSLLPLIDGSSPSGRKWDIIMESGDGLDVTLHVSSLPVSYTSG